MKLKITLLILTLLILSTLAFVQIEGVTNFTGVHIKSSQLGTATPQMMIWNQGNSRAIEVRATSGTVVWAVDKSGNQTSSGSVGGVLQNTLGQEVVCGSQAITAAATVVHTVSTPVAVTCAIAADPAGDQFCTYTNATGVVTVKLWQSVASTPVANVPSTTTSWCVVGTP